jgi:rhodanese-related sulfurtransferase
VGPDRGRLDQESHVPVTRQVETDFPTAPTSRSDGGILDQESHIPIERQNTLSSTDFPARPDVGEENSSHVAMPVKGGGMLDQESHVPHARQNTFSSADFPARPGTETMMQREERGDKEEEPPSVYFVCQRGNDSQIAAQKLIESVQAETAGVDQASRGRRKWGWIGDVKGGFLAMERHVSL